MARPKAKSSEVPAKVLALLVSQVQWMEDELYYDYGISIKTHLHYTTRSFINHIWDETETPTIQNAITYMKNFKNKVEALYEGARNRGKDI